MRVLKKGVKGETLAGVGCAHGLNLYILILKIR